nr:MAG TPA: hypothetical protein [Ackermannviridae sp.]
MTGISFPYWIISLLMYRFIHWLVKGLDSELFDPFLFFDI